jgi:hypothetical protein
VGGEGREAEEGRYTCDGNGRAIVTGFHHTTQKNRDVGYFYLFEGCGSLEDVESHVGEWTDYVDEEGEFWFLRHCDGSSG